MTKQESHTAPNTDQVDLISAPNTFLHVVHMGPEDVLFGGLSATAKQQLQNTTPGSR